MPCRISASFIVVMPTWAGSRRSAQASTLGSGLGRISSAITLVSSTITTAPHQSQPLPRWTHERAGRGPRRRGRLGDRLSQDRACLFLHRAAMARRLKTQLRLDGVIEVANREAGHADTSAVNAIVAVNARAWARGRSGDLGSVTWSSRIDASSVLMSTGDNRGRLSLSVSLLSTKSAGSAAQGRRLYCHDWCQKSFGSAPWPPP